MSDEYKSTPQIIIHNKISSTYRTFHADGAYGGGTPKGLITLSFFSERFPIPKSSSFAILDNKIGPLISNSDDSKDGIIREYEAAAIFDINVAKELIKLLTKQVEDLENLTAIKK